MVTTREAIVEKNSNHNIKHLFSGKSNFFEVISSKSHKKYNTSISFNCDCGGQNNPYNNKIIKQRGFCSHIRDVMQEILNNNTIYLTSEFDVKQSLINSALKFVRMSNIKLNEVRYSDSESQDHVDKKKEICGLLEVLGYDYVTEARFENGIGDIYVPELFTVIEIVKTESDASLEKKREVYPKGIIMKVVRI